MTPSGQTVCLCMIVKDEAPVIRRCLDAVRPLVDGWVVIDAGSTDGTPEIVRELLHDRPGEVVERPWREVDQNRSEALALARPRGDYTLVIDADDLLQVPEGFALPDLDADAYTVEVAFGPVRLRRPHLVRTAPDGRPEGAPDGDPVSGDAATRGHLPLVLHIDPAEGPRRGADAYRKYAALLTHAATDGTDPALAARCTFSLAQCYRQCGEPEEAIRHYLRRADMGFSEQEVYVSLLAAGRLQQAAGTPPATVIETFERATRACPSRAEALHAASQLCRLAGDNARGAAFGRAASALPLPSDGLLLEPWIYRWGALDEYAVNSFWIQDHPACIEAVLRALAGGHVPEAERDRLLTNARSSLAKLGPGAMAASAEAPAAAHALAPPRDLQVVLPSPAPRVLLAILAKQKESVLPFFLRCIEALHYPKSSIVLYIRTNNNTDRTQPILRDWIERVGPLYAGVEFDAEDVAVAVEQFGVHEWNVTRFRVLNHIRDVSLGKVAAHDCDFYFTADCDNFVRPCTLRNLVSLNLPIVAPLLRHIDAAHPYSNYHAAIDANGYFRDSDTYKPVLYRHVTGLLELPVVHCTYAVRADVIPRLGYNDGTERYDYVIFADRARKAGIPQYCDNRQVYGYLTLDDARPDVIGGQLAAARRLMDGR